MLYLDTPPPAPQPIEIHDIGGLVSDYKKQTERFQTQDREVRLIYCRSACTMALSLPQACVYPHSKLFFHMAYHKNTKERLKKPSDELFAMYPAKVRSRLGQLTPDAKMLTGTELISLGVPECGTFKPGTLVAKAGPKPKPVAVAEAEPTVTGSLASVLPDPAKIVDAAKNAAKKVTDTLLSLLP